MLNHSTSKSAVVLFAAVMLLNNCKEESVCPSGGVCVNCPEGHTCSGAGMACGPNGTCVKIGSGGGTAEPVTPGNPGTVPATGQPAAHDAGEPFGLYGTAEFKYIAADGRFFFARPKWATDETFDVDASFTAAKPAEKGTYRMENNPNYPGNGRTLIVEMKNVYLTFATGKTDKIFIARTIKGGWSIGADGKIVPNKIGELQGSFKNAAHVTAGDSDYNTTYDRLTTLDFLPGKRFAFMNVSSLFTQGESSTLSETGNWSVVELEKNTVSGTGTYRIHGFLLTLSFDRGGVAEDVFQVASDGKSVQWGGLTLQ